ncbi:transposase IS4 family protein [Marine Group I thaumarchaeote SCGC AAA799-B03]|uniref:Transposase IS4 family protein n=1 Tax=Marine Group I thaumarchaeote SCGC AAA799-B03 TaxID=1502289 RepID=A0A087S5X9_9ARCH|nr:transposase IS4 family protein [Marine Group I thaumarchaeote SCGC AAA799-B03]
MTILFGLKNKSYDESITTVFSNLKEIIANMGTIFLSERLVESTTASADSSLLEARGPVWHKSDMRQNRVPISGIDTDARWGFSKTRGWIFGYKLHMSCSTGKLIVPLSADFTTANVADCQVYEPLVNSLVGLIDNIIADPAYDDGKLYRYSAQHNMRLVCPIKAYDGTPPERLELVEFYESEQGQKIYSDRKVSIEPLFEIVKDTFGVGTVPVRGLEKSASFVLLCVFVYQIAVYRNCVIGMENPRQVKCMLGI